MGSNRAPDTSMRPLRYADDDAARHHALFAASAARAVLLTVLDRDTQQRFPNLAHQTRPPTRAHLAAALDTLFTEITAARAQGIETELYFLYSGHGRLLPEQEGAVTLQDAELTRADLYALLIERSPADFNHLIIDACNAYFQVHQRGQKNAWRDDRSGRQRGAVQAFFDAQDLERHPSTGVILSTTTEAETHEWARYEGGVFSHQIRSGLLGAADITGDGLVEYSELLAFLKAAGLGHRFGQVVRREREIPWLRCQVGGRAWLLPRASTGTGGTN